MMDTQRFLRRTCLLLLAAGAFFWATGQARAQNPGPNPLVDYTKPNYANSPILRKFVDSLPRLNAPNNLQQRIPVATAGVLPGFPDDAYYEIALVEYREWMHSDLPPLSPVGVSKTDPAATGGTKLRGYVQEINGVAVGEPYYLGPLIVATRYDPTKPAGVSGNGKPIRIKFTNRLPAGSGGDLFIPVDDTIMGAGMGPNGMDMFKQNRATLHLHGGFNPWISDGTPHQWTVPAAEYATTPYPRGVSTQDVPDMIPAGLTRSPDGVMTFYYPNQQSARLMFYHDHAYGITRLNVYAGEAAGYLLTDATEQGLIAAGGALDGMSYGIPLVIQDKSFVNDATVPLPPGITTADPARYTSATDPLWRWGGAGNLWFPHVYMPNQWPDNPDWSGANPVGRWDWGPWFWPVFPAPDAMPEVSTVPEAFMDTPLVNGTAYPYLNVAPKAYRFRILSAGNDRFVNLQLYQADPTVTTADGRKNTEVKMVPAIPGGPWPPSWGRPDARDGGWPDPALSGPSIIQIGTEGGFLPAPVVLPNTPIDYDYDRRSVTVLNVLEHTLFLGPAERADVVIDFSQYAGQTLILYNDAPAPVPAADPRVDYYTGNPDQTDAGGAPSTKPGYGPNTRTIMQIRVALSTDPAVVSAPLSSITVLNGGVGYSASTAATIDGVPGSATVTVVNGVVTAVTPTDATALYASAPTVTITDPGFPLATPPVPGGTGAVAVAKFAVGAAYDPAPLTAALGAAFAASQAVPHVPESAYGPVYGATFPDKYAHIFDTSLTFTPIGGAGPTTVPLQPKCIHELFDTRGRMNSILGTELPFTTALIQTTIPLAYIDPPTEIAPDGQLQLWKITHNGVDTHAIHFHLVDVQVINRVGWDGMIKPPDANELGWKETVRMNPLEDIVVALRPKAPVVPWPLPDSVRLLDVTMPKGSTTGFTGVDPKTGNPMPVSNQMFNFGWEYVWHCHLLGHEENDMMRPLVLQMPHAPPAAPSLLTAVVAGTPVAPSTTLAGPPLRIDLAWQDNSTEEFGFRVERAPVTGGGAGTIGTYAAVGNAAPSPGTGGQGTFSDTTVLPGLRYAYRVVAFVANPITVADSGPSNVARITTPTAPTAPNNMKATPSKAGVVPAIVALAWNDTSNNEVGFSIERAPVTGGAIGTYARIATVAQNVKKFDDTTVAPTTAYSYRIRSFNQAAFSLYATAATATTLGPPPAAKVRAFMTDGNRGSSK